MRRRNASNFSVSLTNDKSFNIIKSNFINLICPWTLIKLLLLFFSDNKSWCYHLHLVVTLSYFITCLLAAGLFCLTNLSNRFINPYNRPILFLIVDLREWFYDNIEIAILTLFSVFLFSHFRIWTYKFSEKKMDFICV